MRGDKPSAAVLSYRAILLDALRCAVPGAHPTLLTASSYEGDVPGFIALSNGEPVPLETASGDQLSFRLSQDYRISIDPSAHRSERYSVGITKYIYAIRDSDVGDPLLEIHWHPEVEGVTHPHLHVRRARAIHPAFGRAHIPSGLVTLERVLQLLIRDFEVVPARPDWTAVLERTRQIAAPAYESVRG